MSINATQLAIDLKELPSFKNRQKDESHSIIFLNDLDALIKNYKFQKSPDVEKIEKTLDTLISSNEHWQSKLNTILRELVHYKYKDLTDNIVGWFDLADKQFNVWHKEKKSLKISFKSSKFVFYFDRNDFWFKPTNFEHFNNTVKKVIGRNIKEDGIYSKQEIFSFIVIYLDKLQWRSEQTWLDRLEAELMDVGNSYI
jgi:hypothetical protein